MVDGDLINDLTEMNSQDSRQKQYKEIQPDPDAIESTDGKMACMPPLMKVT